MTLHRLLPGSTSIWLSLTFALPAAGQVIVGRVDVTPSGGSFHEQPKAGIVGQTPAARLFASSGNRGDWEIGVGATPTRPAGNALPQAEGVIMASLNELVSREKRGGVEVCGALTTGQSSSVVPGSCWVAGFSSAGGVEANYDFALAWFPFSDGWVGAHVAAGGQTILASGNLPAGTALRRWTLGDAAGEVRLIMPGVNALTDGMLFVVSGENGDNVTEVSETVGAWAEALANWCEARKGWVLLLGDGVPAELAPALAQRSQCRVVVVAAELRVAAAALRRQYAAAGLLGARISVHTTPEPELPYRPYLFNLIVVLGKTTVDTQEIYRVLRPVGGKLAAPAELAQLPGERPAGRTVPAPDLPGLGFGFRRDPIPGSGAWTDAYVDSRGSVCTNDTLAFAPYRTLWFGRPGPRHMVDRHWKGMTPLYRNGILYVTGRDYLAGVDAYNGTVHWETALSGSGRVAVLKDCGSMTVDPDDRLYVAADSACVVLDGKTGEELRRLPVSRFAKSGAWWGFVGLSENRLLGTATPAGAEFSMERKADYKAVCTTTSRWSSATPSSAPMPAPSRRHGSMSPPKA